ncbi:hypothetical protein ALT_3261 [Aspergillus lentulus]|uniref:Aminotransferase class I/classII large domain-containing protein n=1 Tax=Aspergillus lentulus TaxID=293939 RepID=A0AAN4PG47_ASPLE|nr:hypothetical protein ALT_3261 [Aspergillus lentulus]
MEPLYHLTYGEGAVASPRLRTALAKFFNIQFNLRQPVNEIEIMVGPGVTSLTDSLAWCTSSENVGIIIPRPLYNGFPADMRLRSEAMLLPASFIWDSQRYSLDNALDAAANVYALERAWKNCTSSGVTSKEALTAIARFCGEHNIHLTSDEIYATSVFPNEQYPNATLFTSVLSLELKGVIDPNLVHVMYGMSKMQKLIIQWRRSLRVF